VHEGVRVVKVLFDGDRAVGVTIRPETGPETDVAARVVVDASGQNGLLMNRLGLRVWDPALNKGAIWTYWEGADRGTGRDEGATMVLQTADREGWFWYIPLHDNIVSIGVVRSSDALLKGRGPFAQTYDEEVEGCSAVRERVSGATRATGYFATKDCSYRSHTFSGDGWVLVGDALAFLDPLYSSGVLLALKSGEMAADAIGEGLRVGDTSAGQLGGWGPTYTAGVDRMRRLVCEYYAGFSFGDFIRTHPDLRGAITDLLIGDLFTDKVDTVWQPMESLYPPDRKPIPAWNAETSAERGQDSSNELVLPAGYRP
jgi:flavin-dependent dehydrogenase